MYEPVAKAKLAICKFLEALVAGKFCTNAEAGIAGKTGLAGCG